jgi:hypothetical protein
VTKPDAAKRRYFAPHAKRLLRTAQRPPPNISGVEFYLSAAFQYESASTPTFLAEG